MFTVVLSPAGQFVMLGASLALALAIVGLGAVRYRGTRNPSALFLTWGFAVLAANIVLVIAWSGLHPTMRGTSHPMADAGFLRATSAGRVVLGWWYAGWVGAGIGLLILRPWWDRRGRKPVDPRLVGLVAIGGAALLDLLVALLSGESPPPSLLATGPGFLATTTQLRTGSAGATAWILAAVAIVVLLAAGARSIGRAWVRILPLAGALLAAVGIALQLQRVTIATYAFRWTDLSFPLALACVFGALLVDERADHTRMRRATDRARAVMGGRAEIASMLGHEVKGPVATIRGLAGTTITHYDRLSDHERQEFLSLIEQESRKLLVTVDQASLGMKVDAGTLTFDRGPTDLAVVVRDALDKVDLEDRPLTFRPPDPPVTATVDRKWLAEALRQTLTNAATYSPPRAPIVISVRRIDGATVAIDVLDQGPGIPADQREAVFQKFAAYRPPGYEEVAGTGLGLFIARGIVRAHGGDVYFSEAPAGGTMLTVRLPSDGPTGVSG